VTEEMAELLGLLAADGYVARDSTCVRFVNNDPALRARIGELWSRTFLGTSRWASGPSGFDPTRDVERVELTGAPAAARWLREQLYTPTGHKQVPPVILNADFVLQWSFMSAYYAGDGLKAGNGESVKTNSPVLAQGLYW